MRKTIKTCKDFILYQNRKGIHVSHCRDNRLKRVAATVRKLKGLKLRVRKFLRVGIDASYPFLVVSAQDTGFSLFLSPELLEKAEPWSLPFFFSRKDRLVTILKRTGRGILTFFVVYAIGEKVIQKKIPFSYRIVPPKVFNIIWFKVGTPKNSLDKKMRLVQIVMVAIPRSHYAAFIL